MTEKQLIELLARFEPALRDAILNGIQRLRDEALLVEVVRMIELGDEAGVLRALGLNPALFNGFYFALAQTFEAGGLALIAGLPKYVTGADGVKTMIRFDIRDRAAEQWLGQRSSGLVTEIEEDVRQSVRDALQRGMREGRNPRNVALDLVGRVNRATGRREGGSIGLTAAQLNWVESARQKLLTLDKSYFDMGLRASRFDDVVQEAIRTGRPLNAETVDKLIGLYKDNALKHRGEQIGRTEALSALNRGEYEAIKQAALRNGRPLSAIRKVWDSAGDGRVRDSHRALDGTSVVMDEPFVSPVSQARMMHPHDTSLGAPAREIIACRCRIRYEIDFAAGVT